MKDGGGEKCTVPPRAEFAIGLGVERGCAGCSGRAGHADADTVLLTDMGILILMSDAQMSKR